MGKNHTEDDIYINLCKEIENYSVKKPKVPKKTYALYKGPGSYGQVYAKGGVVTNVPQPKTSLFA